ncbi:MAG TPA: tetratricopeptide repeat protein, partial [Acetobacteraceae bacterium]|nr:tetratricopeptide repeat protein [Acetobacteraceae bacterium]
MIVTPELEELLARADRARDSRDWAKAAALYAAFLEQCPSHAGIEVQLGHALKEAGRLDEAEAHYRRAVGLAPDTADGHLQLGHALKLLGRFAEAEACYGRASALAPDDAGIARELADLPRWVESAAGKARQEGDACRDRGDWDGAACHYARALELVPGNAGLEVQRGHAFKEMGLLNDAEACYRRAVAHAPADADGWLQLGHLLKLRGDLPGAVEAYRTAARLSPLRPDAHRELAWLEPMLDGAGAVVGRLDELAAMRSWLERIGREVGEALEAIAWAARRQSCPVAAWDACRAARDGLEPGDRHALDDLAASADGLPVISVVMPACDTPGWMLAEAIRSVREQIYQRWELCIADDASADDGVREIIRRHAIEDPRIRFVLGDARLGIAANTNRALEMARGNYVAFLDHDDLLAPEALLLVARAAADGNPGILYSDEDCLDAAGRHVNPHLKPAWNPDLALTMNYVCHLMVIRRDILSEIGGCRPGTDGAQDRDLLLRAAERCGPGAVVHIPRVLYHWRIHEGSYSRGGAGAGAIEAAAVRVVADHLARTGRAAAVRPHPALPFCTDVAWTLP